MSSVRRLPELLTGRRSAWLVLVTALLVSSLAFLLPPNDDADAARSGLPAAAESARAEALAAGLPGSDALPAVVVFSREGAALTPADRAAVGERAAALEAPGPPVVSEDGTVALVTVPLQVGDDTGAVSDAVTSVRTTATTGLPEGLTAQVSGPAGFAYDLTQVFAGADVRLLLVTVLVVALLLIVTYRSPWLWLVPLTVVFVADRVAVIVASALAPVFGFTIDGSTGGILSVLVFGAGTNYALLLIARYREELRVRDDRREAMVVAWRGSAPAILASGGTVALGLLTLLLADQTTIESLGFACAVGIVIAVAFALLVLPAAMVVCGRGLFWPFVPRAGAAAGQAGARGWERLGAAVARRPLPVAVAAVVVLGGLALASTGITTGLSVTEQLRGTTESVTGQQTLERAFPAGSSEPVQVIVPVAQADLAVEVASGVDGVASASAGRASGSVAEVDVVLTATPGSEEAFTAVRALRDAFAEQPALDALVGGTTASQLDLRDTAARDRLVVMPAILVVVLLVLVLLLRALVAPLLLLATVVLSFAAALGASWLLFTGVLGFAALDVGVPLLAFLFLVALGVDYNIFLVTRAQQEARTFGTVGGMIRALGATGGVITSAGVLLAAVFAVLGVLPFVTLTQLGVIVGVGVLLDTLLVRTVLVPALAFLCGDRFWWPRRQVLSRSRDVVEQEAGRGEALTLH